MNLAQRTGQPGSPAHRDSPGMGSEQPADSGARANCETVHEPERFFPTLWSCGMLHQLCLGSQALVGESACILCEVCYEPPWHSPRHKQALGLQSIVEQRNWLFVQGCISTPHRLIIYTCSVWHTSFCGTCQEHFAVAQHCHGTCLWK